MSRGWTSVLQTNFGVEGPLVIAGERLEYFQFEDLLGSSREKRDKASTAPLALLCWYSI